MVQVGVGGLPNAGNSTLLDNILGIKESRHLHCRVAVTNSFLLFESVRISDTLSSRSFWIKSSEASPEVVAISTVLARMYAQGSSLPNLAEISSAVWGEGDPELDGYFRDTLTKVTAFLSKAESEGKLELLASTAVPCLVNWWDVNYTKVTYEIATILAGGLIARVFGIKFTFRFHTMIVVRCERLRFVFCKTVRERNGT